MEKQTWNEQQTLKQGSVYGEVVSRQRLTYSEGLHVLNYFKTEGALFSKVKKKKDEQTGKQNKQS